MTDISYFKIKDSLKESNADKKQISKLIECIKIKIIAFYASSFLFYWYLISAFCAVYDNTQRIFLTDSITSFIMGLAYPFGIYLVPTGLRILSLKLGKKKNLKILYSLSDKIPIF